MIKKIFLGVLTIGVIISGLTAREWIKPIHGILNRSLSFLAPIVPEKESEPSLVFKATRDIPDTADLGSFLAGFMAKTNNHLDLTAQYYKKVLKTDPDNKSLKAETYVLEGLSGNVADMVSLVKELDSTHQSMPMSGYVLVADAMKQGRFEEALVLLDSKKEKELDFALNPLLKAWNHVALNQEEDALKSLAEIKGDNADAIRNYHKALIADYFGKSAQAQESYLFFTNEKLPSLNVLVSMKDFFERKKFWDDNNPLYKKYYAVLGDVPVLFDVLNQTEPVAVRTPVQGAAEAFYMTSVYFGELKMADVGILLNSIALYLNGESVISKVWGAELYESMKLHRQANEMYDRIGHNSDIVAFKKALNFITMQQDGSALFILKDLETRNTGNPLIQTLLAQTYQTTGQYEQAIEHYTRAAHLLKGKNRSKEEAQIYFERGVAYSKLKQFDQTEQDMLVSLKLDSDNAEVLNYLGYEWLERDLNLEEATAFIERANKLTPNEAHILDSLALAYYKQKRYQEALLLAEKAVDKMGASSVANMHLGDIYLALGRVREARSQYEKALALKMDLTPTLKEELLKRLQE